MKAILDFDFDFFIRENPFMDWGHSENNYLFYSIVWATRIISALSTDLDLDAEITSSSDVNPQQFISALKEKAPYASFNKNAPILISDSHVDVGYKLFENISPDQEYVFFHFDAHHDLGYNSREELIKLIDNLETTGSTFIDSSNWLLCLALVNPNIKDVYIIYPEWRSEVASNPFSPDKKEPVSLNEIDHKRMQWYKKLLKERNHTNLHFLYWSEFLFTQKVDVKMMSVCRSGAWVPPWLDQSFIDFVNTLPGSRIIDVSSRPSLSPLIKRKGFGDSWEQATRIYKEQEAQMKAIIKNIQPQND